LKDFKEKSEEKKLKHKDKVESGLKCGEEEIKEGRRSNIQ
jgi:hypothetical protein